MDAPSWPLDAVLVLGATVVALSVAPLQGKYSAVEMLYTMDLKSFVSLEMNAQNHGLSVRKPLIKQRCFPAPHRPLHPAKCRMHDRLSCKLHESQNLINL
jgi:hypothetical protein